LLVLVLVLVKNFAHKTHNCGYSVEIEIEIVGVWRILLGM
jgi:hypothetical protein